VISIGPFTRLSCEIEPGTHPEQDVLCACDEFHGMAILSREGGAEIPGLDVRLDEDACNIIVRKL
jgi:hypothetical protein